MTSREKIPYTTVNGVHSDCSNNPHMWTNGFWGGMMWMMYEATKNEEFAKTGIRCEKKMDKCFDDMDVLHHDVGFMWHIMCGARYRLTGDKKLDKHDPLVVAMKEWIDQEYEDGRQTMLSNKELENKIEELAPGRFHR